MLALGSKQELSGRHLNAEKTLVTIMLLMMENFCARVTTPMVSRVQLSFANEIMKRICFRFDLSIAFATRDFAFHCDVSERLEMLL